MKYKELLSKYARLYNIADSIEMSGYEEEAGDYRKRIDEALKKNEESKLEILKLEMMDFIEEKDINPSI